MADTIRMFHIPADAVMEHLGGGRFNVKHVEGRVELIEVFGAPLPVIERESDEEQSDAA